MPGVSPGSPLWVFLPKKSQNLLETGGLNCQFPISKLSQVDFWWPYKDFKVLYDCGLDLFRLAGFCDLQTMHFHITNVANGQIPEKL